MTTPKLFIEAKPVWASDVEPIDNDNAALGIHMYLVYVDQNGIEHALRAGPTNPVPEFWGNIIFKYDLLENTLDNRNGKDPSYFGQRLILEGDDAVHAVEIMIQVGNQLNQAGVPYDNPGFSTRNSNSTVAALLSAVGIDVHDHIPTYQFDQAGGYVGINTELLFDRNIRGTVGSDIIRGASGFDTLDGGEGNDILFGYAGNDTFYASSGVDSIIGGDGTDVLQTQNIFGMTFISNHIHHTTGVISISSIEEVVGSNRADIFDNSLSGVNRFSGGEGNDRFKVGTAAILSGNAGNDTFYVVGSGGAGSIIGGDDYDIIDVSDATGTVTVDLQNATVGVGTGNGANVFSFTGIEAITYGGVRSIIHGAEAPSRIVSGNGNSTVYGGNASDVITSAAAAAGTSMNIIFARGGNDEVTLNSAAYAYGGDGFDVIHGSSGNDVISGDADSDRLYGGAGDDEIAGGSQSDYIDGGADIDTAVYSFTSTKDDDGSELVAYSKSGNRIIVVTTHDGGRTLERDHLVNVEKVKFLDKTLDFTDPTTPSSFYNEVYKEVLGRGEILRPVGSHIGSGWESAPVPPIDPLALDMDGDGVELLSVSESTSNFEFYVNGYAERSGWVKPDDALLARDVNGNGRIDDITELFGNDTTSGFTVLAALDSNGDGLIDVLDPEYANMLVWNDLNGDGQSTPNELRTLQAAGIGSISTTSTSVGQVIAGNAVPNRGSYTMTDGTIRNVDEVHFTPNHQVTRDVAAGSWTPSHQSFELPSLAAFGYMQSLARAYDLKPGLVSKAEAMMDMAWEGRIEDMVAAMQPFVREWVDVSNVLGNAAQEGMKVISVLNAYRGQQYGLGASGLPTAAAGSGMESEYRQILYSSVAKFMIQVANDPSYAITATTPANTMMQSLIGLEYSLKDDCIVGDVLTAATRLGAMVDESNMNEVGTLLRAITQTFAKNDPMRLQIADAASGAVNGDIITKALVEGYALTEMTEKSWSLYGDGFLYNGLDNLGFGKTTNAEITLSNGNDYLLSGPGNHRISLGTGNDVIMYRLGDGKDFVGFSNEFPTLAYQGTKRIVIDIDSTEVSVSESTDNVSMFLMFTDGGYLGLNSVFRYSVLPDITMEFADGAKWTVADLRIRGTATTGADTILGSVRNDYIDGLAGDDVINGGYGNDYISGGYGNDVLNGGHGSDSIVSNAAYIESWDPVTWTPDPNIWMQGSGTDLINGDEGDDTITLADPHSIVTGGAGSDTLVIVSPYSVTIDLRYDQHTVTNHVLGQTPIVQNISGFEAYLLDWGSNMNGAPNVFEGSSNADQLVMNTESDDVFRGHDGDDVVMTYGGDDIIDGGDGIDTLRLYGSGNSLTLTTDSSGTITVTSSDVPGSQKLISIERIETWDKTISIQSPIVLDMDHDGLALRSMSTDPLFDMNGDGILDRTGWFRSGDGVLALDRNGDGLINKGSEISFIQDLPGARTDMEGLSAHDENHDGLIDAKDDIYSALRIWMDDGDGVSQASEMFDLAMAGIQSIGLDTQGVEDRFSLGDNLVFGTGRFNHVGEGEGLLLDAGLSFQSKASTDMPNLRMPVSHAGMKGYGSIPVDHKAPIGADEPTDTTSVYWNEDLDLPVLLQNATMIMPFDMIM